MKLSEELAALCDSMRKLQKRTRRSDHRVRTLTDEMACRADICHSIQLLVERDPGEKMEMAK